MDSECQIPYPILVAEGYVTAYATVALLIGLFLGILAFVQVQSFKGRVVIVVVMVCLFFLPMVWHGRASFLVSLVGWVALGLGSYIFLKWKRSGPF